MSVRTPPNKKERCRLIHTKRMTKRFGAKYCKNPDLKTVVKRANETQNKKTKLKG
jgi:hypothetical protein